MAEADESPKRCTECGLDAGASIRSLPLLWRVRVVGPGVALFTLLMLTSWAFREKPPVIPMSGSIASGMYFLKSCITGTELKEIAAGAPPSSGRSRLVDPLLKQLDDMRWNVFPMSRAEISLHLEPSGGQWMRTRSFGRPLPWLVQHDNGEISDKHAPAAPQAYSWASSRLVFTSGNGAAMGETEISLGAVSAAILLVLAAGWLSSQLLATWNRRKWRDGAWIGGVLAGTLVILVWSCGAGIGTREYLMRYQAGSGTIPVGPALVTTIRGQLTDPSQTDTALARSMLGPIDAVSDDWYLAMTFTPRFAMVNSTFQVYSLDTFVAYLETASYATIEDPSTPVVIPYERPPVAVIDEFFIARLGANGRSTVARSITLNLGVVSIGLLASILLGFAGGALARRCATISARGRRREGRCIACGYPLATGGESSSNAL